MSGRRRPGRPVQWWSPAARRLHAGLVAGLLLCGAAAWLEWSRALGGHTLAWVYAGEWPLYAVIGSFIWWRLLTHDATDDHAADDHTVDGGTADDDAADHDMTPPPDESVPDEHPASEEDAGLIAWQRYLDDLHRADPPGGPPTAPAAAEISAAATRRSRRRGRATTGS